MTGAQCALYARVSSESQARDNTIASQVTALRERIAADGFQLEPDHNYVDEGYSGAILFRRKRERARGQCWLLQGLTVCRCCGYAYYGKTAPRSRKYDPMNPLGLCRLERGLMPLLQLRQALS